LIELGYQLGAMGMKATGAKVQVANIQWWTGKVEAIFLLQTPECICGDNFILQSQIQTSHCQHLQTGLQTVVGYANKVARGAKTGLIAVSAYHTDSFPLEAVELSVFKGIATALDETLAILQIWL